jgi:AsmA family protein
VSGKHASFKGFLATVTGAATISMRNGSIDSQLLDLAGLGIIPWLFTKDRGPTAPIVCVQAPLTITNGRISTKRTVLETDQVQIVLFGYVDLNRKTLDISGQPRRIGKPLSRSPWPFTAVGPMAKPKIRVKSGPRRLRRSDGATTMPERRKICVPDILQLR